MQRDDERPSAETCNGGSRKPVRVHEICLPGRSTQRPHHREKEKRCQPGMMLQVSDDPAVTEREPVVAVHAG